MDTVGQWLDVVHARHPTTDAADWDTVGLQVGTRDDVVTRVLVCLDVTPEVVLDAADAPGTLVLAHHPLFFRPLQRLTPDTASGRTALLAARAGISVAAAHTNLDVAVDGTGTSQPVANVLGLTGVTALTEPEPPATRGFGVVGTLPRPTTLADLAATIADGLPAPHLRFAGDPDTPVTRVACVGGAGDSLVDAAHAAEVDVYVTGDLRHHVALDALAQGLALVDAGHHATEAAALPAWVEVLRADGASAGLAADVVQSTVDTDPFRRPAAR